jgi:hypothetical protein
MIEQVWTHVEGGSDGGPLAGFASLRQSRLTKEHFDLNAFNKMNVRLAMQIFSQTVVRLIDSYLADSARPASASEDAHLAFVKEMCTTVNRLADLCNARNDPAGSSSNVKIGNIVGPGSWIIAELVECAAWFAGWKHNCDNSQVAQSRKADMFIAPETWQDTQYCLLGIACLSEFYMTKFWQQGTFIFVPQRRLSTDKVEHHFAHIRGHAGAHPTSAAALHASNAAGMCASLTGGSSYHAAKRSNNGGAPVDERPPSKEARQQAAGHAVVKHRMHAASEGRQVVKRVKPQPAQGSAVPPSAAPGSSDAAQVQQPACTTCTALIYILILHITWGRPTTG